MTRDRKSFPFPTSPEGDDRTNRRLSDPTDGTSTSSLSSAAASRPSSDTIKVAVRIRPLVASEQESKESPSWTWSENSIYPAKKGPNGQFQHPTVADPTSNGYHFDYLFYPEHTNQVIFNTMIKNIVSSTMDGFHGSVFSYGQTNSGKTFTMNGGPAQPGVIPQAIYQCFEAVNGYPDREFLLRVSYLEIYNEQIKDLLNTEPANIRIQHDPKVGTVLSGVKEVVVLNPEQVISLIRAGEAHRHVGSTDMNTKSSRSHTLFKVIVESKERNGGHSSAARVSTLNMVDLAGSESAKMTNAKGERFIESRHINQSLLTLSLIIQKLSEDKHGGKKTRHLPYRNSKLTRLLETALDGNAHIGIICTISPIAKCVDESSNTLKFAQRAKMVKMNAAVNEVVDDKTLLRAYRVEIEQLRARLKEFEAHSNSKAATPQKPNGHISSDSSTTADKDIDGAAYGEDDEEEENQRHMLQMIAEMERLILKADASKGIKAKSASRSPTSSSRGENGTSSEQASSSRPSSLRLAVGDGNAAPNSTPSLSNQAADSGKEQDHIAAASHPSSSRAQIVSIKKPADSAVNKSKLRPPLRKSQLKAPTQFAHSSTSHDPSDGKVTVVKNSADGGMDKNVGSQVSISTSNSLAGSIDDQEEDQIDGVIGTHSNRYFVSTDEFDANFVDDNGYSLESPSQEERRNFSLLHSHSKHLVIEEDNVLTGVTKMLEQLKGYIAKPK